jgi:hypothetical protein
MGLLETDGHPVKTSIFQGNNRSGGVVPPAPHNSLRDKSGQHLIPSTAMKTLCRSWLLVVFLSGGLSALVTAQTATVIPEKEAAQHVGQRATVEGTVVEVFTSNEGNAFIDFGGKYPHQTFTGYIPAHSALAGGGSSLADLEGKRIKITGTIDLYKGKPEIKITSKDQLVLE